MAVAHVRWMEEQSRLKLYYSRASMKGKQAAGRKMRSKLRFIMVEG